MKKLIQSLLLLALCGNLHALNPSDFTITRITAPYFIVDGNSPTAITQAYVGFEIKNVSGSVTWSNLKFTINSITGTGGSFTLVAPANGINNIGTLAPGQSKVCYYYVTYPAVTSASATFNFTLSDATVNNKTGTSVVANRSCISANAGGSATQSFTNQDIIGGMVYDDVTYSVGSVQNNDECDFQVAVSTSFDPTKITLISTSMISSTVPGIVVGATDSLYFRSSSNASGASVTVRFTFKITGTNFTTYLLPCAGATSGGSNYKYTLNTNLGAGTAITISSASNPLVITKTANKALYVPNEQALFTVTVTNPSIYGVSIDKITDQVPTGFVFKGLDAASTVTSSNSTTVPALNATGTISFDGGVTISNNNSYYIAPGTSIVLKYTAQAPATSAFNLSGTATAYVGTASVGTATTIVGVTTTLPLTLLSFNAEWLYDRVRLKWTTTNEQNTQLIEIERSTGNGDYIKLGERQAAGFSSGDISYEFMDYAPAKDLNRYRLKMIDADGRSSYSNVLALRSKSDANAIIGAFPNPFVSSLFVNLDINRSQESQLEVYDAKGQLMASRQVRLVKGRNSVLIQQLDKLPHGLYSVRVITTDGYLGTTIMK